jgi:hypothetical protein
LRQTQFLRRAADAAGARDLHEISKLAEFHMSPQTTYAVVAYLMTSHTKGKVKRADGRRAQTGL